MTNFLRELWYVVTDWLPEFVCLTILGGIALGIYAIVSYDPGPSGQCVAIWKRREALDKFPYPNTFDEWEKREVILERAAWCDTNPTGIWF